ncbi:MAG: class I SAM-dependent methyltransferase [Bacteroidaceae bacterium]|nr:class I SAM-dependent methyltransferase [Bacteroidaceae bacterium]
MEKNLTEQFIHEHRTDDVRKLALASHPQGIDIQYALTQISGWQAARAKVPLWADTEGIVYPKHLSMEQCTSQYIAQYKASRIEDLVGKGLRMADITGGMGVDCFFISAGAAKVCYNEMSAELCDCARANFKALGRPEIEVNCSSAEDYISRLEPDSLDLIYLDPARRGDAGRKLVSISDCQPDAVALQDSLLSIAPNVMVKLSPMLDISRALTELKHVSHVFIIGLEGECKEITLLLQRGFNSEPTLTAVDIKSDGTPEGAVSSVKSTDAALPLPIADLACLQPGTYISEPSAPYMKCALFRTIAAQTGTALLHPDTHLFWSKEKPESFPGRTFQIEGIIPFDKRSLSALTKTQANLSVRNFPESAPQLQRRLKLRDGGSRYLIATTLADKKRVLLDLRKK